MLKIVKYALLLNLVFSLLFIYANYLQWDFFNGNNIGHTTLISSHWSPFSILAVLHVANGNTFTTIQTVIELNNTPFLLFWILLIINLVVILILGINLQARTNVAR